MASSELLSEIQEIREMLTRIESMLRFIIEKHVKEAESLPDEVEAIREYEADKGKGNAELIGLDNIFGDAK